MSTPLSRVQLGALFYLTAKTFDYFIKPNLPDGEYWASLYFCAAASVDWFMFYLCQRFVTGTLCRDMEAFCIASIAMNALGFALYMAPSPPLPYPGTYVLAIQGINYVLAIRLLFVGDGNVIHYLDRFNWRAVVRRTFNGYQNHITKEEKP